MDRAAVDEAWSRAGGYEPLCYPKDVTKDMVQEYRESHKIAAE
jgi:hypothetical protein